MKLSFLLMSVFLIFGCKSDDGANNAQNQYANIVTDLPQGTWQISYFLDNNTDETSTYSSFIFEFDANGTVTASNSLFSELGTWAYEDSSNSSTDDDNIEDDEELILTFETTGFFDELSDDWHITSANSNTIDLYDVSGGNGHTDYLTFTKI